MSFSAFDSFQGDFSAPDFVAKLCATAKPADGSAAGSTEFNPVPYINVFESNLLELKKFYLTIEKRVGQLTVSLESDHGEVNHKIASLGAAFDEVVDAFSNLNQVSEKISGTAVRIGKQLESIQFEKGRAEEAREILGYLLELNAHSRCSKLETLGVIATPDARVRLADLLRKLNHIVKADIPGLEGAAKIVMARYAAFEKEMLAAFLIAFENDDIPAMKEASSVLVVLNDASSCIKIFIDKHAFFQQPYDCSQIAQTFFSSPDKVRIPIDFSQPPRMDPGLVAVFDLIISTVSADWRYLDEVFEQPKIVMDMLLKGVFEEIIMRHVDEMLKHAGVHSTAQYLRHLAVAYSGTLVFIDRLVQMYSEHLDGGLAPLAENVIRDTRVHLLKLHADIFGRYIKPTDIQLLESRFLKEMLDICAIPVHNHVNARRAAKAAKNLFNLTSTSDFAVVPEADILQRCRFNVFKGNATLLNASECEYALLPPQVMLRLLRLVSEAVTRMHVFYAELPELSDLVENYVTFFFTTLKKSCIQPTLVFAIENEEAGATCKPFDPKNFALIEGLEAVLEIVQVYFEEQLAVTTALISPTCCRKMYEVKNAFVDGCLKHINALLRLELSGISTHLSSTAQKLLRRSDFKPKPDDMSGFNTCTQYCLAVKDYLRGCAKTVKKHLTDRNATRVLNRIGKMLFEQLIDIVKKLSFNDMGALVLLNDINAYVEMLRDFGAECQRELGVYFGFLRELANILMVRPENLRSVLQEGTLNMIDVRLLHPFIALRSDFKASKIDALFPDMDASASAVNAFGLF